MKTEAPKTYAEQHPEVYLNDEDVLLVTRAIGMSIDGFQFDVQEASYREAGFITVYGKHEDSGRKFEVTLQIVAAGEELDDEFDNDDDDEED